ncbi:hypothetical protein [Acetobacteroides hydrogenigenes]|uniref:Uncharacterized protein n=1 Tax=Acetobacteroides hydrogenigenes TaxID=979970 RepID=A0A4V2RMZ2_9BACT|nr:hypothetical protein [Acetobacteroides hydrogenigenes]TCN61620.1 hypothetical protein CLV25_1253 [Acetobacteroides hydrogenigenes]
MEMTTLFTSKIKKLLVKLAPLAFVISIGCFIASFFFLPTEFYELEKGTAYVKNIEKTVEFVKGRTWGGGSRGIDTYYILIGDSTYNIRVYTYETEKIDSFGINNIIGHPVKYEYHQGGDFTNNLVLLSVNGKSVITAETDWESYLALIFIFLVTGAWGIWGLIIELKKEGYFKDTKGAPRIFKK